MSARTAAVSWGEVMPYLAMPAISHGAACTFVAHSVGKAAPEQVFEVGAIWRSRSAAEARREMGWEREMLKGRVEGMAAA